MNLLNIIPPVYAQPVNTNIRDEADALFEIKNIGTLVSNIVTFAIAIGALLTLGYFVWGALEYITAEGDKSRVEDARNKMLHSLIGLALLAVAWVIWRLAIKFLGIGTTGTNAVFNLGI